MASKAVAPAAPAALPDLVSTQSNDGFGDLDSRDIQPPRLKVASPTTGAAANGYVPNFCLFSEKGSDDTEPVVLVKPGEIEGITVYVLKTYKTWAANVAPDNYDIERPKGGTLRRWYSVDMAPPFVRENVAQGGTKYLQHNYVCYVPDVDDSDLPHNLLLAKTSMPAARTINTAVSQRRDEGLPPYSQGFKLWAKKREATGDDGTPNRWAIFQTRPVAADPEHVAAASAMYAFVNKPIPTFEQRDEALDAEPAPAI